MGISCGTVDISSGSISDLHIVKRCRLLIEGKVKFRYECPDYPCDLLKTLINDTTNNTP
jgi:hypothetical protein